MTDTPKTVEYLPADPDYVMALAIFHAQRGDPTLLKRVDGELRAMRAEREAEEARWLEEHRPRLCRHLASVSDVSLVRRVAGMIGYSVEA